MEKYFATFGKKYLQKTSQQASKLSNTAVKSIHNTVLTVFFNIV